MQFHAKRQMEMNISCEPGLRLHYLDMQLQLQNSLKLHVNARLGPPEGIDPPRDGVYHYLEIEPNNTEGIQARMRLYIDEEEMQGLPTGVSTGISSAGLTGMAAIGLRSTAG